MSLVRACTICGMARQKVDSTTMQPIPAVQRYSLYRRMPIKGHPTGKTVQKGFGGIDICDQCFDRECRPSMRKTRKDAIHRF